MRWPQKKREVRNVFLDSTHWDRFKARDGDIVIASWGKSGTTLTQQVVTQLLNRGDPTVMGAAISPWIEFRLTPNAAETANQLSGRRVLKTHLPLDALAFSQHMKYVYVARDPRDVVWSLHNHHASFTAEIYRAFNRAARDVTEHFERPNPDVRCYYNDWLDKDGYPFWPYWSHIRGWWQARQLPNVLLVHFANLRRDLPAETRRIAEFIGIEVDEGLLARVQANATMEHMRQLGRTVGFLKFTFEGGADDFINKGTNGRWREVLTNKEISKCDRLARRELPEDCARWLTSGEVIEFKRAESR